MLLASSVCPLMDEAKRFMSASWWMGKTGSCSGGQGLAQKSFNQIICWWVGLHSIPGSCLAWGDPALGCVGSMVDLMVNSKRLYAKGTFQCPRSCGEPLPIHASTGDPPTLAGSFGSVSCVVTAPLLWVLVHARFGLCLPSLESLFLSVLWKAYNQILLALKARFHGDFQSRCWILRLGNLMWGSEPSQQWTSLVLLVSSLWITHLVGMGFDFIVIVPLLPYHCGFFVFGCAVSFWWVPASSCWWLFNSWLQFWCSHRRDEHTPSTPLSWTGNYPNFKTNSPQRNKTEMKVPWPRKFVSVRQTMMIVLEKLVEPQSWYLDFMGKWESFEGFYDREMLWLDLKALGLCCGDQVGGG